jgi:DNA modification methylase
MLVQKVPVSTINPAVYNPRIDLKPEDPEYQKLKQSITKFGYVEPIVWNRRTGNLVGGHQRFKILAEQGLAEVDASVVDLPLLEEKALNLALNKIQGKWDNEKLASLLDELSKIPDFDIDLTGFDKSEISQIFDRYLEQKDGDDFDFNATLENIKEPKTKRGDRIILGRNVLLCADSTVCEDVKFLMGNETARLVNMDPPYNIAYLGGNRPNPKSARPKRSRNWDRIYADNLSQEDYEDFLKKAFLNMDKVLEPGCSFYIWNGHYQFAPMHRILTELKYHIGCVITWAKPNFAISYGDYHQQTEFALYGWKEGSKHRWFGGVNESSLWEVKRDPTSQYVHPTQKPVELAQRAIRNSSERGDVILDMFLGSGSTLIASEILGRRCFGIEYDPRYCDAICQRYINFVGADKVSPEILDKYLSKEVTK